MVEYVFQKEKKRELCPRLWTLKSNQIEHNNPGF